jgi:hypothetical protein
MTQEPTAMTIGQLGHHIGLHVSVDLQGKTIGGVLFESEHWVSGVVVGLSALGDFVTIQLDESVSEGEHHGLFHRKASPTVSIDDPQRVRAVTLAEVQPGGVPPEIAELVRAGKMVQAIRQYRALNGATLDEARAALAKV